MARNAWAILPKVHPFLSSSPESWAIWHRTGTFRYRAFAHSPPLPHTQSANMTASASSVLKTRTPAAICQSYGRHVWFGDISIKKKVSQPSRETSTRVAARRVLRYVKRHCAATDYHPILPRSPEPLVPSPGRSPGGYGQRPSGIFASICLVIGRKRGCIPL